MPGRFLTLDDVAVELATSRAQVYALVRRGELRALKLGGRGVWRIERAELEAFVAAAYDSTRAQVDPTWSQSDGAGDDDP